MGRDPDEPRPTREGASLLPGFFPMCFTALRQRLELPRHRFIGLGKALIRGARPGLAHLFARGTIFFRALAIPLGLLPASLLFAADEAAVRSLVAFDGPLLKLGEKLRIRRLPHQDAALAGDLTVGGCVAHLRPPNK